MLKPLKKISTFTYLVSLFLIMPCSTHAELPGSLKEFLSKDRVDFLMNYRFEHVQDPTTQKYAYASTLRTVFGYKTPSFSGFRFYFQVEDVSVIGNELYNDGGANGKTRYAVVVDPDDTELNQYIFSFEGIPDTELKAGRQLITYRDAPLHRFVGPVVWRQNWQTFDGYTISNKSLPNTHLRGGYIYNINRIFGEDNDLPNLSDKGVDGYLFNGQYTGFSLGTLEAYTYLLDFDANSLNTPAGGFYQSTATYGGRFHGNHGLSENVKLLYEVDLAGQEDYAQNPHNISAYYFLGELGAEFKIGKILDSVTLKGNYELLSGDGGADRFTTPLATLHPFQGWADKFLNTPGDGIEDMYFTAIAKAFGANFVAVYHDFNSDNDSYDYGSEIDLLLTKNIYNNFTVGLKYSFYEGDTNAINVARNAGLSTDITKFWGFITFKY